MEDLVVMKMMINNRSLSKEHILIDEDGVPINQKVEFEQAVLDVYNALRSNNFNFNALYNQYNQTLSHYANQNAHNHHSIMNQLRKYKDGEQRINELDESIPVVADASGNPVSFVNLEADQWYFYSQGYAFRGYWEPKPSHRQNYKGQGIELGLLKALDNGWALGGMLGLQKIKSDMQQTNADSDIYRVGPFLSWSDSH